jgi:nicotinate-nucleotide adenylyltransferase
VTAAIFGGTFDPIHLGHLVVADHVAEAAGLARVVFVPAGRPPHKAGRPITPARDRLAMVELAIAGNPRFSVSRLELESAGGPSFTIDTVRRWKAAGEGEVALILGADSLVELDTWREPEALLAECRVLVVGRPGVDLERAPAHLVGKVTFIAAPRLDISSSEIRERVAAGRSIRYLVPEPVREYILGRDLYRPAGSKG